MNVFTTREIQNKTRYRKEVEFVHCEETRDREKYEEPGFRYTLKHGLVWTLYVEPPEYTKGEDTEKVSRKCTWYTYN